ncbi:MAG: response regulator [Desulfobacteraceae bacterium]|nr:response regulator [Desulfobacteraceae bacterium]
MNDFDELLKKFEQPEKKTVEVHDKPKILVIDDDPSIRRGLDRAFSHKYKIILAESGKKGVEELTRDTHCVILDVKMKELNGFSTYPKLKEKSPDVPIIFYTAFQSEHDLKEVINKYKPEGYIEKGTSLTFLENLVANAVHKYQLILENEDYKQDLKKRVEERTKELQKTLDELKETQTQLVQTAKMASIGELAAGIAHQINNPMAIIDSSHRSLIQLNNKLQPCFDELLSDNLSNEHFNIINSLIHKIKIHFLENDSLPPEQVESRGKEISEILRSKRINRPLQYGEKMAALQLSKSDEQRLFGQLNTDNTYLIELLFIYKGLSSHLRSIDFAKSRIYENINALKDFVHLDQEFQSDVDIHRGIESTLKIMESKLKQFEVGKKYQNIPFIQCHPGLLNQVWQNITANALQSMGESGRLIIETFKVDKDKVGIRITDSGCGIPDDLIDRIFEPYFTTKGKSKSMGLGLSMSYKIIKRHNGLITVKSEVNKGTTFEIILPISYIQNS